MADIFQQKYSMLSPKCLQGTPGLKHPGLGTNVRILRVVSLAIFQAGRESPDLCYAVRLSKINKFQVKMFL